MNRIQIMGVSIIAVGLLATGIILMVHSGKTKLGSGDNNGGDEDDGSGKKSGGGGEDNGSGKKSGGGSGRSDGDSCKYTGGEADSTAWTQQHNGYRRHAGYADLEWDSNLAQQALCYANELEQTSTFAHDDLCNAGCRGSPCNNKSKCGQNLEMATGSGQVTPETSVSNWYGECKYYNGTLNEESGHYTQVMWKDANKLGCGVSQNGTRSVCLYDIGNVMGQEQSNLPPVGSCQT